MCILSWPPAFCPVGWLRNCGLIPGRDKWFWFSSSKHSGLLPPVEWVIRALSPGISELEWKSYHWPHPYGELTLSNPIFLPPAYSPALIYFGQERGRWVTCNYPTVLKEKNRNSTTCAVCGLKSVLHEEKCREQENHNVGRSDIGWERVKDAESFTATSHMSCVVVHKTTRTSLPFTCVLFSNLLCTSVSVTFYVTLELCCKFVFPNSCSALSGNLHDTQSDYFT
jgi:hypothetical protein